MAERWFTVRRDLSPKRQALLTVGAFLLPLLVWCVISYVPFIWHPLITVTNPGGSTFLAKDMMIERGLFAEENAKLVSEGHPVAQGYRTNPMYLPAPHAVAQALYTAFITPPLRRGEPWLHEALWRSIQTLFWGFTAAAIIGVPIGILCGTFDFFSKLTEPFVDFIRYMPAPAFGALMVGVFGIHDAPKIAIIFIGTFFQLVLVVANTTRQTDRALLEAAQTLGAKGRRLVTHVVLPGILPNLYTDLRILLGWAWTYLIVAELIGATSGISYFINREGRLLRYENVFAGIIIIGVIGFITDQVLTIIGRILFPWQGKPPGRFGKMILACVGVFRRKKVT